MRKEKGENKKERRVSDLRIRRKRQLAHSVYTENIRFGYGAHVTHTHIYTVEMQATNGGPTFYNSKWAVSLRSQLNKLRGP